MKKKYSLIICSLFVCICCQGQYADLYNFNNSLGSYPVGGLTFSGNSMFGATDQGGVNQYGTVFSLNIDGTGYAKLFEFNQANGQSPTGSLVLSNGILYGMTNKGGENNFGRIFSIHTDGTGFSILLDFNKLNGAYPRGSLIISGDTLYGATYEGGNLSLYYGHGGGTLFSIHTDGSGFRKLMDFDSINGAGPVGNLTLSGNKLFGMTNSTIFSINTDGTGFTNFGQLLWGATGTLILQGNILYGSSVNGGLMPYYPGFVFSIHTDGSGFTHLHDFNGVDGNGPTGNLIQIGSTLYGGTYLGGATTHGSGSLFSIHPDGSGFNNLFDFDCQYGCKPLGYMTLIGDELYGIANDGGTSGVGAIYTYKVDAAAGMNTIGVYTHNMTIYPNPSTSVFTISYFSETPLFSMLLLVTNSEGQVIYTVKENQPSGVFQKEIDLSGQPSGIYLVEVIAGTQRSTKNIILQ